MTANDIKKGMIIKLGNDLMKVVIVDHHQSGGKAGAIINTKLKNISTGHTAEHRFAPHDKIEDVESLKQKMDFVYATPDEVCFMNPQTFEQISIDAKRLGNVVAYLKEGMSVDVEFVGEQAVSVIPPELAIVKITSTTDPIHTDADSVYKAATIENGQDVLVPQFIKVGDQIHVRIETGEYIDRVKEK